MRVNRFFMPILVIVVLLGTTFIAQAAGFWSTSGKDSTDLEDMTAADLKGWMTLQHTGTGSTPLPPGQMLPANQINGRMTLRDVSDQCGVPLDQLLATPNLPPESDPNAAIKDLISQGALSEVTAVKDAVAKLQQ